MRLNILLLSSAALLVSGSVFAADLPAKKAAPAAAASTGCPAFGAGYFQIPGGDTCLKISGYFRSDSTYQNNNSYSRPKKANYSLGGKYILGFDTKSNTELGTISSRVGVVDSTSAQNSNHTVGTPTTESAYVNFAGITAGFAPSTVDFDNAYNNSGLAYQPTGTYQLAYTASLGASTFTLGAEATTWTDYNMSTGGTVSTVSGTNAVASRPDLTAVLATKVGDMSAKLGLVSHEVAGASGGTAQGFATLGRLDYAAGPFKAIVNAAYAQGAVAYIDNNTSGKDLGAIPYNNSSTGLINDSDQNAQNLATGQIEQLSLEYAVNPNNTVYGYVGAETLTQSLAKYTKSLIGGGVKMTIAKNLYIRPEYYHTLQTGVNTAGTAQGDVSVDAFYLRIRRDF